VGGAALILQGIGNRPTADIDASYGVPHTIHTVVAGMAAEYDPAPDRLNTNTSALVPDNAPWVDIEQLDGLTLQAADTEMLLAMKIAAGRDNSLIVVEDALDAAIGIESQPEPNQAYSPHDRCQRHK
jgi:hypothetical protein